MITLSLNFAGITGNARAAHEKKVRNLVDTHFGFPGSDKLKMDVTLKDNGYSSVSFAGPSDVISEAKRIWQENVKPAADKIKANVVSTARKVKAASVRGAKKTVKKAKKSVTVAKKKVAPKKKAVRAKLKVKATKKNKKR
jgi:hypothetical protein